MQKEKYHLTPKDLLDLWKYFDESAAKIKDKLWTIATWLFALLAGVLGLVAKNFEEGKLHFSNPGLVAVLAVLGIVLSIYTYWMIKKYGGHIRTAWNRSNRLRRQIPGLNEIWDSGKDPEDEEKENDESKELPPFAKRLQVMCIGFGVIFLLIFIFSLFF